jgi:hypothetical protein
MIVSAMTIPTSITSTARKIMEVFRYFRIRKNECLSIKLLLSKRHLWRDIEEDAFSQAMGELMELGYIKKIESPAGWRLLEAGDEYLKQLELKLI